ncbi:jmjC domain-containing protein 7-like [Agrilus planipennis]|uniref:JmjC domain-containing protein 7-like n=1 Tax=Agrilus planipennis TaxID=224129 RepID=A0A1W4XKX6_AGRPL|nr:jmjC domain-containing protein 7-like [Agrilus planipennis]
MCYYEKKLNTALQNFKETTDDFIFYEDPPSVFSLNSVFCENTLEFYRDYVAKGIPLLLKGACQNWNSTLKWSMDYFMKALPEKIVRVDVTPNGLADGIATRNKDGKEEDFFMLPEEQKMTMKEFIENLQNPKDNYVCYIQSQNSNFYTDYDELHTDIDLTVDWADRLFDKVPDAINFWMGDSRAVTSMHKDPYENVYFVIDGYKDFILIPPTELPFVPYEQYPIGQYKNVTPAGYEMEPQYEDSKKNMINSEIDNSQESKCKGDCHITKPKRSKVSPYKTQPWVAIDPLNPDLKKYPEFARAKVLHARVSKGDCLYLPPLWFHHVRQSHGCIAINYWYDMDYDIKYCCYELLKDLCTI